MTSTRDPILHYLHPTLFLTYGWAYGFTVFSTLLGVHASSGRHPWPEWVAWPLVVFGFAACFAVVIGLRPVLLDLAADLGVREKLGLIFLHMLIFIAPRSLSLRATLIDCLIALQVPMALLLLSRASLTRLYVVNFLIVSLSVFFLWTTDRTGFLWAACLPVFVCGCFAADHFFFEIDRYPTIDERPFLRPLLLSFKYAVVAVAGGGVLYALTPALTLAESRGGRGAIDLRSSGGQPLSNEVMLRLIWDTFILLVLLVIALAVLQYLKRRFQRHGQAESADLGGGVMKMVRKVIQPRPKAPEMPRGFSPREQILRGYWSWCYEMERFGLVRDDSMTPKEYADRVIRGDQRASEPVETLTNLFESAKYDQRAIPREDAEAFFEKSRHVIDAFLTKALDEPS